MKAFVSAAALAACVLAATACGAPPIPEAAARPVATSTAPPSATPSPSPTPRALRTLSHRVVARYPHDPDAFTQGLVFERGRLFESTGLRGRSSLREVDMASGAVLRMREVPPPFFAEGLALVGDELVQITWQESTAFRYSRDAFEDRGTWSYAGEGWGLAYDGDSLIMSDGSAQIRFRDPATFAERRVITVTEAGEPVVRLNELEWIDGAIWANVWQTDRIMRIDPSDGMVTGVLVLRDLLEPAARANADVLNGIAWDPERRLLLVTGKLWPTLFALEIVEQRE
jgi:glutamine cyclotransferase